MQMRQKDTARTGAHKAHEGGVTTRETIALDYPQEGETINGSQYTIRISAADSARSVEICVDQGPWEGCRQAAGFWWHDWSQIAPGEHQVRARMTDQGGNVKMTMLRWFHAAPAA
jgi:hypothetical protein